MLPFVFEQDYIVRAIRQFVAALTRILAKKLDQRWEEAQTEIAGALVALTGLRPEHAVRLPLEGLRATIRAHGELDGERGGAVARLLKEQGEVLELSGAGGANPYYVKAFCLLDELSVEGALPEEHEETLRWLVDRLD